MKICFTIKDVAVEPPVRGKAPERAPEAAGGRFVRDVVQSKTEITPMKVVFPNFDCNLLKPDKRFVVGEGDTVYVRGEIHVMPWANHVHELDGKRFVLVPEDQVVAVKRVFGEDCDG